MLHRQQTHQRPMLLPTRIHVLPADSRQRVRPDQDLQRVCRLLCDLHSRRPTLRQLCRAELPRWHHHDRTDDYRRADYDYGSPDDNRRADLAEDNDERTDDNDERTDDNDQRTDENNESTDDDELADDDGGTRRQHYCSADEDNDQRTDDDDECTEDNDQRTDENDESTDDDDELADDDGGTRRQHYCSADDHAAACAITACAITADVVTAGSRPDTGSFRPPRHCGDRGAGWAGRRRRDLRDIWVAAPTAV